jgi:hypothetical protein
MGAAAAVAPGIGVVEGGPIPYKPEAAAQKKKNSENRLALDPETKCYLPGVPRATYMPYPFQIIQSPKYIMIVYTYARAVRTIYMDDHTEAPADSWMGWSNGHWEGDTLVVDSNNFSDVPWMFAEGRVSFHSDALHIVERYHRTDANTLEIDATVEDSKVLTAPWTVPKQTLVLAPFDQIMELNCSGIETQSLMDAAAKENYGKK